MLTLFLITLLKSNGGQSTGMNKLLYIDETTLERLLHSKKILGHQQENAEVRNGKMEFSCFRPIFGPIWTNFTCFRQKFGQTGPKVSLKQENCIFLLRTSALSCLRPKNFSISRMYYSIVVFVINLGIT